MTAGTVIDTLASMGKWTGYSGSALNQSQQRAADGLEFNKELKKVSLSVSMYMLKNIISLPFNFWN